MSKKFLLSSAMILLTTAATAEAQDRWPHWYIGIHGSLPFVGDTGMDRGTTTLGQAELDNPGWGAGASLGCAPGGTQSLLDGMRFEIEYAYRANDLDTLAGAPIADDVEVNAYMFNIYYDVDTQTEVVPYLGAGLGWADIELNVPAATISDSDDVFAYQFMAGLAYEPEMVPNTAFSLGYRYFKASDPSANSSLGTVDYEYDYHAAELGARFMF